MTPHVETQYQYVMRKMTENKGRIGAIADELQISRSTINAIRSKASLNPSTHIIQKLHDYFRKAGE